MDIFLKLGVYSPKANVTWILNVNLKTFRPIIQGTANTAYTEKGITADITLTSKKNECGGFKKKREY
jgi:hypothetical protein